MNNYIIYRAFGDIHFINECRYALLHFLSVYNLHPPAFNLIIFTDQPSIFDAFTPFIPCLQLQEIQAGNEPTTKATFLKTLSQTYEGNILYCDADTYFTQPLEPVFQQITQEQICVLPAEESNHKALLPVKITDYFSRSFSIKKEEENIPPFPSKSFSLHTVGFRSADHDLWTEVDQMQTKMPHLSLKEAEQFAFNYFLQHHKIHNLQGQVVSYRNFPEFKMLLYTFFKRNEEENIPNLIKRVHHLNVGTILQDKNRYHQLPLFKKLLHSITGKAWSIRQYENKM